MTKLHRKILCIDDPSLNWNPPVRGIPGFGFDDYAACESLGPMPEWSAAEQADAPKKTLVLEDDPVQRYLLERHLDSLGLQTFSAATIAEARRSLAEHAFVLALFDVQLPDGSGLDFCAEIDEDPLLTGLPIVVLSNLHDAHVVRNSRASGARFFISKPYDPNVLLTVIERILGEPL